MVAYVEMIERALPGFLPRTLDAVERGAVVERGVVYPWLLLHPTTPDAVEAFLRPCADVPLTAANVTDRLGHRRPAYRGMLFHCIFRALQLAKAPSEMVERWRDRLNEQLVEVRMPWSFPETSIPANQAATAIDAMWMAIAANTYLDGGISPPAADFFGTLVCCQQPRGAFLTPSPSDNPETLWYHELVLLHAATLYAAYQPDANLDAAIARAAEFHVRETQPDHATDQPWALAAFARSASTRPMADQMLHAAATMARPGGSAITSILLADALYCLARS